MTICASRISPIKSTAGWGLATIALSKNFACMHSSFSMNNSMTYGCLSSGPLSEEELIIDDEFPPSDDVVKFGRA